MYKSRGPEFELLTGSAVLGTRGLQVESNYFEAPSFERFSLIPFS